MYEITKVGNMKMKNDVNKYKTILIGLRASKLAKISKNKTVQIKM